MLASLLIAMTLLGPASSGGPQFSSDEARGHFDDAVQHFGEENFLAASESLRLAYEVEAVAELLYARAQAERRLEHWTTAAELYAAYLVTNPPRDQADNARAPLLFCRAMIEQVEGDCAEARSMLESYLQVYPNRADAELAAAALTACEEAGLDDPEPTPPPTVAAPSGPPDDPEPVPPAVPDKPWHKDLAGGILVGSGLTVAAAGTAVALVGRATFIDGTGAPLHSAAVEAMDTGITLERVGIGVAAGGGLVALVGVVRWISVGVRPRRRATRRRQRGARAHLVPAPVGVALRW